MKKENILQLGEETARLLQDLKASHERGAASLSCGLHQKEADELVALGLAKKHEVYGHYITEKGLKRCSQQQ